MLDRAEVELVDVEVVRFLNACQSDGADIANGSRSIRAWMLRERICAALHIGSYAESMNMRSP